MNSIDQFQQRYEAHQIRKKRALTSAFGTSDWISYTPKDYKVFKTIINNRRSQRTFNNKEINIEEVLEDIDTCPSSCDRKGVYIKVISERDDKDILSGLLVGGVGWVYRANKILLLFADPLAYKAGDEIRYMPYLDAGVIIMMTYLSAEVHNIGCCYINPNIREANKEFFNQRFNIDNHLYCGALALGNYDLKATL